MSLLRLIKKRFSSLIGFFLFWYRRLVYPPRLLFEYTTSRTQMDEPFHKYRTIKEFGYKFTEDGKLVNIKDGSRFQFDCFGNRSRNQRHYEALGEVITEHVYELLEKECDLEKHYVPVDGNFDVEGFSFVFMSRGALQKDTLLLLVHGSGVVRAGQWARRLIINDCLDSGTQIPYIKRAIQEGYGVVVLNTNDNRMDRVRWERERRKMRIAKGESPEEPDGGGGKTWGDKRDKKHQHFYVRDNDSPERHLEYVWKNFVADSKSSSVLVVAHSYGGVAIVNLADSQEEVLLRLKAVAFTDSVHGYIRTNAARQWFDKNSVNWVSSSKELDTELYRYGDDCIQLSAGSGQHEMTSWSALESVFTYFKKKLKNPGYRPGEGDATEVTRPSDREPSAEVTGGARDARPEARREDDATNGNADVDVPGVSREPSSSESVGNVAGKPMDQTTGEPGDSHPAGGETAGKVDSAGGDRGDASPAKRAEGDASGMEVEASTTESVEAPAGGAACADGEPAGGTAREAARGGDVPMETDDGERSGPRADVGRRPRTDGAGHGHAGDTETKTENMETETGDTGMGDTETKTADTETAATERDAWVASTGELTATDHATHAASEPHGRREETHGAQQKEETHGAQQEETHGVKQEETHGVQQEETHGVQQEETHGAKQQETHGAKQQETHGAKQEETHGAKQEVTHGAKQEETHGAKQEETHGAKQEETHGAKQEETHGAKQEETHGAKQQETHRVKQEETHRAKQEETHGAKQEETHGAQQEETHRVKQEETHGAKQEETHGAKQEETHGAQQEEQESEVEKQARAAPHHHSDL